MVALLLGSAALILLSAFSSPLARLGVTSAMAFVLAGLVLALLFGTTLGISLETNAVLRVAELALVFLLFNDAARLDLGALRRSPGWPARLLALGLPLTLLLGFAAGAVLFPSLPLSSVFLLSAMLCATDAALGHRVVEDPSVPVPVRRALNVESGLNDGIAVPFFLVSLDITVSALDADVPSAIAAALAQQIGWGLAAGVVVGCAGGYLQRAAAARGWFETRWRQPCTLAVALAAYAAAVSLGGSAFLSAFVAGLAFRLTHGPDDSEATRFTEETGGILAAATWMVFGAFAVPAAVYHLTWQMAVYAVLSLTAVRILAVGAVMAGSGAPWQTRAFLGWFGPRGLASVVFALLAFERGTPAAETLLAAVAATVGLSVFAHGLSAKPLVAVYHRWSETGPGQPAR
ncbi:cation:proton antiporter [Arthrobacter gandavensis]|uniref:cation:proton antiporter domain-containing protein n=1 Tax=Arthrobacter gandavensis TaxID=169960 RepID=UPI00188E1DE9|nr:cation:proton antiporter [Arthrobacter gandavensis]MBF4995459.1 cation:proton antiporter [Arthrobacter gandavensis]